MRDLKALTFEHINDSAYHSLEIRKNTGEIKNDLSPIYRFFVVDSFRRFKAKPDSEIIRSIFRGIVDYKQYLLLAFDGDATVEFKLHRLDLFHIKRKQLKSYLKACIEVFELEFKQYLRENFVTYLHNEIK